MYIVDEFYFLGIIANGNLAQFVKIYAYIYIQEVPSLTRSDYSSSFIVGNVTTLPPHLHLKLLKHFLTDTGI